MIYPQNKKIKRNKIIKISILVLGLAILFYFSVFFFDIFSGVGQGIFRPIFYISNKVNNNIKSLGSYFSSKKTLYNENIDLRSQIEQSAADRANYASVADENTHLKEILSRKKEDSKMVLGAILAKPNKSLFDTVVIDVGSNNGVKQGDKVLAFGDIPIGKVGEVYANSSIVILYSTSGEKTEVMLSGSNTFLEIVGRGGGNFEMIIPRDFKLLKYDQLVLPGITPRVVGIVETIISDPRDSFQKALLVSPVNIQKLKFLEVEISR